MADLKTQIVRLEQLHYTASLNEITDTGKRRQWTEKTLSDKLMGKRFSHSIRSTVSHITCRSKGVNWNYTISG